jgi:chromosome segregation ATPase
VEHKEVADRQLDALLERLDRLTAEVERLGKRIEHNEGMVRIAHELQTLNESLNALAYAALGQQAPHVRRRRTG